MLVGRVKRVRLYLGEDERVGHQPAHVAVLELLRREGAAGATAFRAVEGFGAGGELHVAHLVDVAPRVPILVEWIDAPAQVDRLLPAVLKLADGALVTVEEVEVAASAPDAPGTVLARLTAGDAMTRKVVAAARSTLVGELARRMIEARRRAVPVVEGGMPVGIVTHGDLVARGGIELRLDLLGSLEPPEREALLAALGRSTRTAADVMTPRPVTVTVSTPLATAAELMARRRLKRLPVVDAAGRLAGMLSRVDVLRAAAGGGATSADSPPPTGLEARAPVSSVMRRDVPTVREDAGLAEVLQAVISTRLNRALVVDADGRVLGVVSDAEVVERISPQARTGVLAAIARRMPFRQPDRDAPERRGGAPRAADLMAELPRAPGDMPLRDAIALVLQGAHKLLAIVDREERLLGVLDRADLLHGLIPAPPSPATPSPGSATPPP